MITRQNYHQDTTHISKSGLDLIARSPRHYWHKYFSGEYNPSKEAAHFRTGTAFHCAATEPGEFFNRYSIAPKVDRRTIDGRETWSAFEQESEGKIILRSTENEGEESRVLAYDQIVRMRDSVMAHPIAAKLLRSGTAEQIFTGILAGVACKIMVDFMTPDGWIVDLKSTKDSSEKGFRKSVIDYRYHVQAAFYLDLLRVNDINPKGFIFIACEKKVPYICETHYLDADFIQEGRRLYRENLETYVRCMESGVWPGYHGEKLNKISYQ